jgi:hypothetical protein
VTGARHSDRTFEARVDRLLARAYQLAALPLEGIEEAAKELVGLSADDLAVVDQARRLTAARVANNPTVQTKQVAALIRRAIEVGMSRWRFDDTGEVP